MAFPKKPKKELPPWKKDLFAHHQSKPSKADRGEFPRKVLQELIAEAGGLCQVCCSAPDTTTHHVWPRGRVNPSPGRGVKTNGLRCCWPCHDRIQTNEEELQYWINVYRVRFGEYFWFDEQDLDEYNRRRAAEQEAEEAKRQRLDALQPIVALLSTAAGRRLNAKEIRLISALDDRQTEVFTKLMRDVVESDLSKPSCGYGERFED